VNSTSSIFLAAALCLLQGCAISTRVATDIPPGKDGNDRALGCGPVPELEPYIYRIPTFQAAVVVVEFDHLPTKETANVRISKSSGIKEIDDSAVRAVAKWKCELPPLIKNQAFYRVPFRFVNPLNPAPPAKLSIAWAGTYTVRSQTKVESASSITGFSTINHGIEYGEESNRVVAKLGASFGVWLKLESVAANDTMQYRYVWKFPPIGLVNPRTGLRHFSQEGRRSCSVGEKCLRGWQFAEEWELVPGTYTFELWQGDNFLEARSFEVHLD
jgi:TonB family protein